MLDRLRRAYPLKVELVPLLLALLTSYILLSTFPGLSDQVPTHFNPAGQPDRWGTRVVLLLLWVAQIGLVYIPASLFGLALAVMGDFRSLVSLPGVMKRELTADQAEAVRIWAIRLLLVTKTLAMALLAVVLYNSIRLAQGETALWGGIFWAVLALLLVGTAFIIWRLLSLQKKGDV
ncbi:MAG: DUF1648 domain-containing protein [Dehalococcoidia bacterium]|nr:DUF1648 domain-containing protein [Dehalococcoidia bacterium]MDP7239680.1 DUF1648 domain-containing protein [Dehalococcoidia bacterium]